MIKHVVMWKFSNKNHVTAAKDALDGMKGRVPSILSLETGVDFQKSGASSYDLVLITTHQDRAQLDTYQADPVHGEVKALLGGLDLLLREPSSRPLKKLSEPIAFSAMVPLQIEESLSAGDPMDRIFTLLIGGGELHPATREKLSQLITPKVYESFGMTETYTHFALKQINGPEAEPCFRLLEGVSIGLDERSCLVVEIPGITSGPLVTNDLVEINDPGDGFCWQGRFDNLINSGGVKLIPELLEESIRESIGLECLVLSEPDRILGNRLVLVVEYQGAYPPLDEWLELLRNRLSSYELPRRILTTPVIPRNPSMKPDRTSARDLLL